MTPLSARLLAQLRQGSGPLTVDLLASLSDLNRDDRRAYLAVWSDIPGERRLAILEQLGRLADDRFELNFDAIDVLALDDPDPRVRSVAIRNLWENEESSLADRLLEILNADPEMEPVRAAARALGHFVLLGELGQLADSQLDRIVAGLLAVFANSPDEAARRLCVESRGYSSHPEASRAIESAFIAEGEDWHAAALLAMGRSANADWAPSILPMLRHPSPRIRREAAAACGELELSISRPDLIELLEDSHPDVRRAAIWSLGQIGGKSAYRALQRIVEYKADPEEAELADRALENLAFVDGSGQLLLYATDDGIDEDLADEVDEADEA
jgi:HEAT repeat protein